MLFVLLASVLALPDASQVSLSEVVSNGSGCGQNTVQLTFNEDRTEITMKSPHYKAIGGNDQPITESRKNCQVNFKINKPDGWKFALSGAKYGVWMDIPEGVQAVSTHTFYYSGEGQDTRLYRTYDGPKKDAAWIDYTTNSLKYGQCDASTPAINVNNSFRVEKVEGKPFTLYEPWYQGGQAVQYLKVQWEKC